MSGNGLDADAAALLAELVQCNVDATARTTNQLLDWHREERDRYARLFANLYHEVVRATETVTTRQLEAVIDRFTPDAYRADNLLDGELT